MAEQQNSPFARVANGYDPKQVAAFASEALSWKKELATLRSEVAAASKLVDRYESVIGSVEEIEREAAEIVADAQRRAEALIENAEALAAKIVQEAENEAARILDMADAGSPVADPEPDADVAEDPVEHQPDAGEGWLAPEPVEVPTPDPVEQIFEPTDEAAPTEVDVSLERRAAGAANLWKRRGLVAPSD